MRDLATNTECGTQNRDGLDLSREGEVECEDEADASSEMDVWARWHLWDSITPVIPLTHASGSLQSQH